MYGKLTASTGGALAWTGFQSLWLVVAGLTLVFAGLAIMKLMPKRDKESKR
jgi:uncharacterized membrane protein